MRVYTNPIELAKAWEKRADLYGKGIMEIHKVIVKESHLDFIGLLSGNIKEKVLRQMGHPFAKEHFKNSKGFRMRGVKNSFKRKVLGLHSPLGKKGSIFINSTVEKSKLYDPELAKLVGPKKSQLTRTGNIRVYPINIQTRELIDSVVLEDKGKGITHMFATSPHQTVLTPGGTKRMVDRKIFGEFGMLRRFHKARLSGITRMIRNLNKKVFP